MTHFSLQSDLVSALLVCSCCHKTVNMSGGTHSGRLLQSANIIPFLQDAHLFCNNTEEGLSCSCSASLLTKYGSSTVCQGSTGNFS